MNQQPDNPTAELQLRAERKLGQLIPEQFPNGNLLGRSKGGKRLRVSQPATLEESGISRTQSSRWQKVADVPEPEFQDYVSAERAKGGKPMMSQPATSLEDSGISRTQSSRWQKPMKYQAGTSLADSGISRTPTQGPPMSRHRSTAGEIAVRVEAVDRMLARRLTRTQIHQEAERLWGVGWQSADRYMLRARENALRTLGQTKEDATAESFAFLASVIRDPQAEVRDKLAANRDIGELLGLYPPRIARLKGTGPDGDALTIITVIAESPIDPGK